MRPGDQDGTAEALAASSQRAFRFGSVSKDAAFLRRQSLFQSVNLTQRITRAENVRSKLITTST